MADRKISDLTALTTPASGDYLPIVDISEAAAASKNKRVTVQSLFQGIPVNVGIGTSSPEHALQVKSGGLSGTLSLSGGSEVTGGESSILMGNNDSVGTTGPYVIKSSNRNLMFGVGNSFTASSGGAFTEYLRIDGSGRVGIGASSPTTLLDVNADTVRVRTARTPASATATGDAGEICWDANYIYVCTATNTWKRAALSTW